MAAKQGLTEDLAAKAQNGNGKSTAVTTTGSTGVTPKSRGQEVRDYIEKMLPDISRALPNHLTPDRLLRIVLTAIRTTPDLMSASLASLGGAILQAAQLGLEPNTQTGQCYLIPFKNTKLQTTEVQFIIGYKGYIELFYRSGMVETVYANAVHENDEFVFSYGIDGKFYHKPVLTNRGAPVCYYAFGRMKGGAYNYVVMSIEDVNKIRNEHSASYKFQKFTSPWTKHYDEMAKKTCLRQLADWLPKSPEIVNMLNADSTIRTGVEDGDFIPEYDITNAEIVEDDPELDAQPTSQPEVSKGDANAEPPEDFFSEQK